mmetsp:Transcript_59900/g.188078  ORF Transcript_59900/g.188078 Transcript_59900/m.188078 type:complete len:470 (-) Transcript_59900:290-1699(-)
MGAPLRCVVSLAVLGRLRVCLDHGIEVSSRCILEEAPGQGRGHAVHSSSGREGLCVGLHNRNGVAEVFDELVCVPRARQGQGQVDARGILARLQVPPVLLLQAVRNGVAVDARLLRAPEGDHANIGTPHKLELLNRLDPLRNFPRGADNLLGRLDVALLAEAAHCGPCSGHGTSCTRPRHRGSRVDPACPFGQVAVHVVPQLVVGEHHDGAPLGCKAVLVRVARNGRDPLDSKVELRDREAGLLHEGDEEPSKAAVDVKPDVPAHGELAHLLDGVDRAMRKLAGRADDRDGVAVDQARHVPEVHLHLRVGPGMLHEDVEVLPSLVERGVGRVADDDVGLGDALLGAAPVPVRLHRHEDALGPARGKRAAAAAAPVVQVDDHLHHLGVHLPQSGVDGGVQRVREAPLCVDLADEVVVLVPAVVDGPRDLAPDPVLGVQILPLAYDVGDLLLCQALDRQPRLGAGDLLGEL